MTFAPASAAWSIVDGERPPSTCDNMQHTIDTAIMRFRQPTAKEHDKLPQQIQPLPGLYACSVEEGAGRTLLHAHVKLRMAEQVTSGMTRSAAPGLSSVHKQLCVNQQLTSIRRSGNFCRRPLTFFMVSGLNFWPPKPGSTVMISTYAAIMHTINHRHDDCFCQRHCHNKGMSHVQ